MVRRSCRLDGNNTYTGATNVTAGTLIANHANALGTLAGATTVSSGATVRIAGGLTIGEAFTISGTGKQVSAVNYGALHLNSGLDPERQYHPGRRCRYQRRQRRYPDPRRRWAARPA
jgi:hypothetical protein